MTGLEERVARAIAVELWGKIGEEFVVDPAEGRAGWHAARCLAYPGGCDCDAFAVSDYDAYGMTPPGFAEEQR